MLTAKALKSLKPRKSAYRVWDADKSGFGVQVSSGGTLTFFQHYRFAGKRRFYPLGRFDEQHFTLKEARALARQKRAELESLIRDGIDPQEHERQQIENQERERQAAREAAEALERRGSLEQLLEIHLAKMRDNGRTDNYVDDVRRTFRRYVSKEMFARKVADITPRELAKVIAKPLKAGKAPTANRLRTYLHTLFQAALVHDHDPANLGSDLEFGITANPVAAIPKQKGVEGVRNRELSFEEIGRIWRALTHPDVLGSEVVKAQLRLQLLLAGMHFTEVGHARWSEFDLENRIWDIPGKRGANEAGTKNGRRFILPICDMALGELQALKRWSGHTEFLFPNHIDEERPMPFATPSRYVTARLRPWMDERDRASGLEPLERWNPANFRSTVKTRLGQLGYNNEQRSRLQNHGQSGVDVRHYDRWDFLEEKWEMLEKWERAVKRATG